MHSLLLKFMTHYSQDNNSSWQDEYILKAFTYQKSLWCVSMQDNDFDQSNCWRKRFFKLVRRFQDESQRAFFTIPLQCCIVASVPYGVLCPGHVWGFLLVTVFPPLKIPFPVRWRFWTIEGEVMNSRKMWEVVGKIAYSWC